MKRCLQAIFIPGSICCLGLFCLSVAGKAETFRVASYNADAYVDTAPGGRRSKSAESRRKVVETIVGLRPDVIALQEMGGEGALAELQTSLRKGGLDLPYHELVPGADTNIHVAILSRFPFSARRPQTNDVFLLNGRRFKVSRGFGEVDVQVNSNYTFTLITAHLKSRRAALMADEAEQRLEEAKLLRRRIDAQLARDSKVNLVVLGDLNDTPESKSTKTILGREKSKLVDTGPKPALQAPTQTADESMGSPPGWTYFYAKENSYSRIDYLLLSEGMAREWVTNQTQVWANSDWALASDHRPLVATFEAQDQ